MSFQPRPGMRQMIRQPELLEIVIPQTLAAQGFQNRKMEEEHQGMSVLTLCKISQTLCLSADYILFGSAEKGSDEAFSLMLGQCSDAERTYAEQIIKTFVMAIDSKKELV